MPRHISRERDKIGSSKKVSPKVDNPTVQKALDEIYKELNKLELSVSKEPIASESTPIEGITGDIRLYTKKAIDGSSGYFIQGKFGEAWASGRLGVQLIDPELPENSITSVKSYVDDGGEYITKLGVTYENLAYNSDVGEGSDQVARGNHSHSIYDAHIADTTIHFILADIPTIATVKNTANQGVATTAARSDHVHKLDTSEAYTWTNKQTITVSSGDALDITGDVSITGDLTVDYAATGDGNGNANIDGNVILNIADVGQDYSDTYTTRINGKLTAYNETVIQHNDNQLSIRHGADASKKFDIDVNANAVTTFTVANNEGIRIDASSVLPSSNLTTNLGSSSKKWLSIHAGELIVENLVAQDVMATIGGRIMVAPTTKLFAQLTPATAGEQPPPHQDTMDVVHNIFAVNDIAFLQTAPGGIAQIEAVQVTQYNGQQPSGAHRYTILRNIDGSGPTIGNTWEIDDAVVNLGYNSGEGFIDITSTQGIYSSAGPHISMHARNSSNSSWQVPEIMRIGNLNGTWYTGNDKYGLIIGDNLDNQPSATSNPFKGFLGTKDGVELYNSPIKTYDGANLIAYMGADQRSGVTGAQFALGENLTFTNDTTSGAKLKFEKNASSGAYELTIDQGSINVTVDADAITDAMPWLDNTPDGAGFYVTGNYAGFYNNQGGWDVILGKSGSNPHFRLGNVSSGPSLEYDGTNLNLKNLTVELDNANNDVYIGENISDKGTDSQDDVIIGSWQSQTDSASVNSGILVKHGSDDYSQIISTGFNRRGFDYPILIYSGYHWGGPIYYTANNGQNSTQTTFPANFFERPFSLGGPYSGQPHRKFPHAIKGCKISQFWGYDKTTVPTGRKLVWNFQRLIANSRGNVATDKFWNNDIDYDHGRRDTQFMHNSSIDYAAGFWTSNGVGTWDHYWDRYNNDYNADGQHHFGYWPDGCSKHVHNDAWCYHGLRYWQSDMEYVSSNYHGSSLYMSYGEIEAGTNVQNLYLLSGFNSNSSTTNIKDGIYGGIFTIHETDA